MARREKSKAAYMISSVAEQYGLHPQTLRLYEREGLLKPSRSDGNTRLYLVDPNPAGFRPLASTVVLAPGDNWAPLALVDGKLLIRGQKELKVLQVTQ